MQAFVLIHEHICIIKGFLLLSFFLFNPVSFSELKEKKLTLSRNKKISSAINLRKLVKIGSLVTLLNSPVPRFLFTRAQIFVTCFSHSVCQSSINHLQSLQSFAARQVKIYLHSTGSWWVFKSIFFIILEIPRKNYVSNQDD